MFKIPTTHFLLKIGGKLLGFFMNSVETQEYSENTIDDIGEK